MASAVPRVNGATKQNFLQSSPYSPECNILQQCIATICYQAFLVNKSEEGWTQGHCWVCAVQVLGLHERQPFPGGTEPRAAGVPGE